MIVEIKVV